MCIQTLIVIPPRLYRLANGEEITIRQLTEGNGSSKERMEVRKRLLANSAYLLPGVMEVATDSSSSVIFIAVKNNTYARCSFVGFVVVNTNFVEERRVAVIAWVSVLARFQKIHVGRSLLQHVESFCRANHLGLMEVMCTEGYTLLFRRYGFRVTFRPLVFKKKSMQKSVQINVVPPVPLCVANGTVTMRYANLETKKEWISCLLEACGYTFGNGELVRDIMNSEFRVEAIEGKNNRVVAILSMDSGGWISIISCTKEYRGQGLGSFLLFLALEWLRQRGGHSVSLVPLNKSVTNFYMRCAFRVATDARKKRKRDTDSHIILTRTIDINERYLPDGYLLEDFLSPSASAATQLQEDKCRNLECGNVASSSAVEVDQ